MEKADVRGAQRAAARRGRGGRRASKARQFANPRNAAAGSLRQKDAGGHRRPAAALLRPWLGRGQRRSRRHSAGGDGARSGRGAFRWPDRSSASTIWRARSTIYREIGSAARRPALRHRRRRLQGRPARLAAAARPGRARAALGARPQIPGRARRNHLERDRHPGRPHRQADAGGAAGAGDGRRRRRHQRDPAQSRRDRAARRAARRPRRPPARRRRHPADRRGADPETRRGPPSSSPTIARNAAARRWREEGEIDVRCTGGLICPAQRFERLRHFVSRGALDIEGLGEKSIAEFLELGWLNEPADIFRLRDHRDELVGREGWQAKSVDALIAAIEAKRAPDAARLLFGLGIRHVGSGHRARPAEGVRHPARACATIAEAARAGDEEAAAELERDRRGRADRGRGRSAISSTSRTISRRGSDLLGEVSPPLVRRRDARIAGHRQDHRLHRQPRGDVARRGQGAGRGARRQGGGLGLGQDRPASSPGRARARSSRRRPSSASR